MPVLDLAAHREADMSDVETLKQQFSEVFNRYAAEGAGRYPDAALSHVCFKFSSMEAYADYVAAARELGRVTQEEFNGKQITWCKLDEPLKNGALSLEWLELVEPRTEKHAFDGVANIGYAVPGMAEAVKSSSADGKMTFRYQKNHASAMAPK
jgi:predicted metalloenzyme YecM